jgi:uridine kinase
MGVRRPFFIGVACGTGSGTTTAGEDQVALIRLDSYYVSRSHEPIERRAQANYDHPVAFDWILLDSHLAALCCGETIPVPVYDYTQHDRSGEVEPVRPAHLQFVEPSKRHADVIIPHGGMNEPALDVLLARVRELVALEP